MACTASTGEELRRAAAAPIKCRKAVSAYRFKSLLPVCFIYFEVSDTTTTRRARPITICHPQRVYVYRDKCLLCPRFVLCLQQQFILKSQCVLFVTAPEMLLLIPSRQRAGERPTPPASRHYHNKTACCLLKTFCHRTRVLEGSADLSKGRHGLRADSVRPLLNVRGRVLLSLQVALQYLHRLHQARQKSEHLHRGAAAQLKKRRKRVLS